MIKDILEALKCRDEEAELLGRKVLVRELNASATFGNIPREQLEADQWWLMLVRCVFDKETGLPIFQDDDIPELKLGSRNKLGPVLAAFNRVNGLDVEDNEKKSTAQG
jgi:hypothetical protein